MVRGSVLPFSPHRDSSRDRIIRCYSSCEAGELSVQSDNRETVYSSGQLPLAQCSGAHAQARAYAQGYGVGRTLSENCNRPLEEEWS